MFRRVMRRAIRTARTVPRTIAGTPGTRPGVDHEPSLALLWRGGRLRDSAGPLEWMAARNAARFVAARRGLRRSGGVVVLPRRRCPAAGVLGKRRRVPGAVRGAESRARDD